MQDEPIEDKQENQPTPDLENTIVDELKEGTTGDSAESAEVNINSELEKLHAELAESKDKYLRLYADFENLRRRTAKERIDLILTANQDLMKDIIPVIDDFERAIKAMENTTEINALKEGIQLVFQKFTKVLENKGLKAMESSVGKSFDLELHESITQVPAPDESMKGKVIDELEKGYSLNDKILRFAKVVVGS
jgi:molecular chaperone GrpE